ncbi:NADH oxidoreductase hcr [Leminorella richardii]|uniref:NADH oxidoreductase hcr n=1 Tax=Leminorella richardii TaxID=158841 RepID=A0A2X4UKR9_9GAMM|nr:NADH oxidoreductase [Leminorella richardii]SQI39543.1 NADH oxidoreductase hcr [Leminorella richardii]
MTSPTPLCPNAMQVHGVHQETDDVWTIELIAQDFYPYSPGQYALVSIRHSDSVLRAYTLSSSPGLSRFITLTVRRLENGEGSGWLTQEIKPGDTLWLSEPQGEFTCINKENTPFLMLAGGCGVTPIMSMTRWLLASDAQPDVTVIYHVHTPNDVIFAQEWASLCERYADRLRFHLATSASDAPESFVQGHLSEALIQQYAPNVAKSTVMTCGPEGYMEKAQDVCLSLGVAPERFYQERFHTSAESSVSQGDEITMRVRSLAKDFSVPVGATLLYALEQNGLPVIAACRSGVCGSCKTQVLQGEYTTTSQSTLTEDEISQGYVLACSCQLTGSVEIA